MTRAPQDPREYLSERDEITPGLWMGRRPASYVGYGLVVSCEWHLARKPMEGYEGITLHVPMKDEDDFVPELWGLLVVSLAIQRTLYNDKDVLVHCTGGLNRSGVVVSEFLKYDTRMTGREAVDLIRAKRDEFCLCNRAFERLVIGEVLSTAETSAFRPEAA